MRWSFSLSCNLLSCSCYLLRCSWVWLVRFSFKTYKVSWVHFGCLACCSFSSFYHFHFQYYVLTSNCEVLINVVRGRETHCVHLSPKSPSGKTSGSMKPWDLGCHLTGCNGIFSFTIPKLWVKASKHLNLDHEMQVFPTSFSPSSTLYWRTESRFPDFSRYKRCIVIYLFHI